MGKVSGKIVNPISVVGDVISEIESPINLNVGTDMNYQSSSLSTFLKTDTALFLPTNLFGTSQELSGQSAETIMSSCWLAESHNF